MTERKLLAIACAMRESLTDVQLFGWYHGAFSKNILPTLYKHKNLLRFKQLNKN